MKGGCQSPKRGRVVRDVEGTDSRKGRHGERRRVTDTERCDKGQNPWEKVE